MDTTTSQTSYVEYDTINDRITYFVAMRSLWPAKDRISEYYKLRKAVENVRNVMLREALANRLATVGI